MNYYKDQQSRLLTKPTLGREELVNSVQRPEKSFRTKYINFPATRGPRQALKRVRKGLGLTSK